MSVAGWKLRQRRNRPPDGAPWVWLTREMIESEAWGTLSLAARRLIDRVEIEHMDHAGTENGNLIVTYNDLVKFGLRRSSISGAIKETVERGLLVILEKGRRSTGPDRWPTRYALGWLPLNDGTPAANRWKAWTKRRSVGPIPGNIESSTETGTRENRRIAGAQVPKTALAPSTESGIGELAEILNLPVPKLVPGKMNLPRAADVRDIDTRATETSEPTVVSFPELPYFLDRRKTNTVEQHKDREIAG